MERQELLAFANTHGTKLYATGGSHVTTDDFFKAIKIPKWNTEIKTMVGKKVYIALLKKMRGKKAYCSEQASICSA